MKSSLALALACCVGLAGGCKTDASTPAAGSAAPAPGTSTQAAPGATARSGRIDMPQVRPKLNPDGTSRDDKRADFAERRRERMKQWDADGDGKLSDDERVQMHKERFEGMHARFDQDGDGKLTPEELGKTRWFRGETATADLDGDGDISPAELEHALETSRPGRGPRPDFKGALGK